MKNKRSVIAGLTIVGLTMALVVGPATADNKSNNNTDNHKPRYSVEGIVGKAYQENRLSGYPTLSDYAASTGVRGAIELSPHIAFEASYLDYGQGEDAYFDEFDDLISNGFDSRSFNVGLKGSIRLSRVVSLIGRIGIAMWELDFTETDSAFPGDIFRDSDEGTDTYFGVGLQMNLDNNFIIAIEYTELDLSPNIGAANTNHTIENVSLSAGFRF